MHPSHLGKIILPKDNKEEAVLLWNLFAVFNTLFTMQKLCRNDLSRKLSRACTAHEIHCLKFEK